jgi:hypothetical protein
MRLVPRKVWEGLHSVLCLSQNCNGSGIHQATSPATSTDLLHVEARQELDTDIHIGPVFHL